MPATYDAVCNGVASAALPQPVVPGATPRTRGGFGPHLVGVLLAILPNVLSGQVLPPPLDPDDFAQPSDAEVRLGQQLFYDPILSGNRSVSCATCHHPRFATGDGLSLGIGDGGVGLGPDRRVDPDNPPEQRIPRNAPPLFNLGHGSIRVLFADGRIEEDPSRISGFRTPLGDEMVAGFDGILSAQTMFPVLSPDEMAGHYQENDVAQAVRQGLLTGEGGAWDIIAVRVAEIPEYRDGFAAAFPDIAAGRHIAFADVSNAIAAFMAVEWRADDSPFDRHLRGQEPLTGPAAQGLELFWGRAGCSACHSGSLLSDQQFYAMGEPQLGPGKAGRFESHRRDIGRQRVTGRAEDAYRFRTPMLRNVAATGPWGHAGAHAELREFLRYHADPASEFSRYDRRVVLPDLGEAVEDWAILDDPLERGRIVISIERTPVRVTDAELDSLVAFVSSLTDPRSLRGRLGVPSRVPSGLPVENR